MTAQEREALHDKFLAASLERMIKHCLQHEQPQPRPAAVQKKVA